MKSYLAYQRVRFREALKRSWEHFAPTREHIILFASISIVAFALQWIFFGQKSVTDELPLTLIKSVGAIVASYVLWLAVCVGMAPYWLWKRGQESKKEEANRLQRREIAKSLQIHVEKGLSILERWKARSFTGSPPHADRWVDDAERLIAQCGEDELAAFRTLRPDDADVTSLVPGETERNRFKGLVNKARRIMMRQFEMAKERPPKV
jgi:hypothetical protein